MFTAFCIDLPIILISFSFLKQPGPDEVLIKVTAAAINPVDWKIRDYEMFVNDFPAIVGTDAAGLVVQVGSNVKNLKVGNRVLFQGIIGKNDYSTLQQYTLMPAELVGLLPKSISEEEGASVCLAGMAVIASFYHKDGIDVQPHPWQSGGKEAGKGQSIVIIGGSSSVGQYAIQLASLSGFSNIITASSPNHHQHLQELGAHVVLDRNNAKPEDYAKAAGSFPLLAALDSISSSETGILAIEILQAANPPPSQSASSKQQQQQQQPTMIHLLDPGQEIKDAAKAKGKTPINVKNVWGIGSAPHLRPVAVEFMKALSGEDGYLAKGNIKPNRPLVIKGGLYGVEEALIKNKEGISGQKLIVKPHEE